MPIIQRIQKNDNELLSFMKLFKKYDLFEEFEKYHIFYKLLSYIIDKDTNRLIIPLDVLQYIFYERDIVIPEIKDDEEETDEEDVSFDTYKLRESLMNEFDIFIKTLPTRILEPVADKSRIIYMVYLEEEMLQHLLKKSIIKQNQYDVFINDLIKTRKLIDEFDNLKDDCIKTMEGYISKEYVIDMENLPVNDKKVATDFTSVTQSSKIVSRVTNNEAKKNVSHSSGISNRFGNQEGNNRNLTKKEINKTIVKEE